MNQQLEKKKNHKSFEQILSFLLQICKPFTKATLKPFDLAMSWDMVPDMDLLNKYLDKFADSEHAYTLCLMMDKHSQKKPLSAWQQIIHDNVRKAIAVELKYPEYLSAKSNFSNDDAFLRENALKKWLKEESVHIFRMEADQKSMIKKSRQQKEAAVVAKISPAAKIIRIGKLNSTEINVESQLPLPAIESPVETANEVTSVSDAKVSSTENTNEVMRSESDTEVVQNKDSGKNAAKSIFKEWYYKVTCCIMGEQIETVKLALTNTLNYLAFQRLKKPKINDREYARQLFFESSIEGVLSGNLQNNYLLTAGTLVTGNSSEVDLVKQEKNIERIAGLTATITELKSDIARLNFEKSALVARYQEYLDAANHEKQCQLELNEKLKDENIRLNVELTTSAGLLEKEKERYGLLKVHSERELQKHLMAVKHKFLNDLSHDVNSAIEFLEHEGANSVELGLKRLRRIKVYIEENLGRV